MSAKKLETIKISVRNLVEFIFRSGDITSSGSGIKDTEAMQTGSRIHRKIQRQMGSSYESEVPLFVDHTLECKKDRFILRVEGRADGIIHNDPMTVDEIKGVYFDIFSLKEPVFLHKAQAMCYAYMLALEEELPEIGIQITYCHLETEQIRRFYETLSFVQLENWFFDLLERYSKWAMYEYQWKKRRNKSIQKLEFPFPYRNGQKDLAVGVYRTIQRDLKLYLEAPTGVGKTICTIFPALKAMGENLTDRIFYLTAKTITRTVAEECFDLLSENKLTLKPITITSKEKVCILEKIDCNPSVCPRAKGHFDRINEAVYDLLINENRITRELLLIYAEKHMVCPYEMSLDAALFADAIICDYNYVFDPKVYLRRFFASDRKTNTVLLIDEAHNLVERGRKMYSAILYKEDFLIIKRILKLLYETSSDKSEKKELSAFIKALESANRQMLEWKRECDEFYEIESLGMFQFTLLRILGSYDTFLKEHPLLPERDILLNFYFELRHFSAISELLDDKYTIYSDYDDDNRFRIKLQCMDPSVNLGHVLAKVKSSIFFSATLLPIRYYREQLSGNEDDYAVYAPSSFSPEQREILIAKDVSSKYTRRNEREYQKFAQYLLTFIQARIGNYLAFFPSYSFLEEVLDAFKAICPKAILIDVQKKSMSEKEKEHFLETFIPEQAGTHIGFCVLGGIFSEGIDLTHDRLIGVAIVGTGLPMVCHERELFRRFYQQKKGNGFGYAYLYPGINKVLQSGGRVIRTADDKGVVLLLDERFATQQYLELFPKEWFPNKLVTEHTLQQQLEEFWNEDESSFL